MKIAILGFAREGKSLLKFLKNSKKFKDAQIKILDQKLDKNYLKRLPEFDLVFRSPGVPCHLPEIRNAIKKGVKFSSSTKLFFELCQSLIIGITGTKGKGTASTLLYQILQNWQKGVSSKHRRGVWLAGNIGKPAIAILPKIKKADWAILELSSFQLQDLKKPARAPKIAVILDIFDDHLDVHKNFTEYINAKTNLIKFQRSSDAVFYFKDNAGSTKISKHSRGAKIGIDGEPFGLKKNFVMAAAVAAYLGCPPSMIVKTIKKFKGLKHRLELVATIKGVDFYNDSASTNPRTTIAAIQRFNNPIILVAGGKDKNLNYSPLVRVIKQSPNLKSAILFGENKTKLYSKMKRLSQPTIKMCRDLKSAVKYAHKQAEVLAANNHSPIILFSPGSASFDMFKDYQDRGEQFIKIVKELKKH